MVLKGHQQENQIFGTPPQKKEDIDIQVRQSPPQKKKQEADMPKSDKQTYTHVRLVLFLFVLLQAPMLAPHLALAADSDSSHDLRAHSAHDAHARPSIAGYPPAPSGYSPGLGYSEPELQQSGTVSFLPFSPTAESFGVSAQIGSGVRGRPLGKVLPPGFHEGSTRFCEGCGVVRALKRDTACCWGYHRSFFFFFWGGVVCSFLGGVVGWSA